MEALELYNIEKLVKSHNEFVLDRNTDAVRFFCKTEINIKPYFWDIEKTVPKYQAENTKPLRIERCPQLQQGNVE
jgi:hypothetical protein